MSPWSRNARRGSLATKWNRRRLYNRLMRVQVSPGTKEKRLAALLQQRGLAPGDPRLAQVVEDAQLLGSLELAGLGVPWSDVRASRRGAAAVPAEVAAWRRARAAVVPGAPLDRDALRRWHAAFAGPVGFRRVAREREGAPPAPPEAIESRLETLEEWLTADGLRDLEPAQAAGLAYARLIEVLPFEDANGRVARLAASHLMEGRGEPPPILVAADGPYLLACLRAAFRLDTEPLVSLLVEASSRATDVAIQAVERGEI